jgi:hypothetical protein
MYKTINFHRIPSQQVQDHNQNAMSPISKVLMNHAWGLRLKCKVLFYNSKKLYLSRESSLSGLLISI